MLRLDPDLDHFVPDGADALCVCVLERHVLPALELHGTETGRLRARVEDLHVPSEYEK